MNCIEEQIDLPLATNATREGPIVELRGASLTVKYDCEDDRGGVSWVDVNFEEVLAGGGEGEGAQKSSVLRSKSDIQGFLCADQVKYLQLAHQTS